MLALLLAVLSIPALAAPKEKRPMMTLESAAFKASEKIPVKHACDGEDVSPALAWSGVPKQAKSLALVMEDPDAPVGLWIHWLIYDIPAAETGFKEGLAKEPVLPSGAKQGKVWGVHKFDRVGYWGPCPPPGKPHRYFFRLYALSAPTGLKPQATKAELMKALEGKTLATAELVGLFGR